MTVRLSVVLRLVPCVNEPGIGAVRWRQCGAQAIGVARHQNEVSMIGHGQPGPASTLAFLQETASKSRQSA